MVEEVVKETLEIKEGREGGHLYLSVEGGSGKVFLLLGCRLINLNQQFDV